jgi:hypothetical protein
VRRLVPLAAVALLGAAATQAGAAGTTPVTFELTAGDLSISVPSSTVSLGSVPAGASSLSTQLGDVTVTDARGALVATWTASVSASSFTTGTGTTDETVPATSIGYASGAGAARAGQVGTMVPGSAQGLAGARTAASWTGTGADTVTWRPTLTFVFSASQVAGTYTGTVTHSVS